MPEVWFRRLGDVPQVGYAGSPRVDRLRLPGHDATPDPRFGSWPTPDGSTSQSPAKGHFGYEEEKGDPDAILQRVLEAIELPGTPTDYHFILLPGIEALWRAARYNPELIEQIEALCLLDLRLVEAYPTIVEFETPRGMTYVRIPAFDLLIRLYRENGFFEEARDIARRAHRFDNGGREAEAVEEAVKCLKEEDVD